MPVAMDLLDFAKQLRQEVFAAREIEDSEEFAETAFSRRFLDYLAEAGEIEDAEAIRFRQHGVRASGYALDVESETLDLFISIYSGDVPPRKLDKSVVEGAFKQLITFLQKARGD